METRQVKYKALLVDPPWSYKVWSRATGLGRSAELHYPTMSYDDLCQLDIATLSDKDCALFMWATMPCLPQAIALGEAWGFAYKTCALAWAKKQQRAANWFDDSEWFMGMGHWTRANVELCLLFTRGHPKRKAKNVRQLIVAPVRRHSQKPDEQYERIEALVDGPYLEIFARQARENWDRFGNEVESNVIIERKP